MVLLPLLVAAATGTVPVVAGPPAAGHYDAEMCVTVGRATPNCGPVRVEIDDDGDLAVAVFDFTYVLNFRREGVLVVTLHGTMVVSEFVSSYRWAGDRLLYADTPRATQYELRLVLPLDPDAPTR